MIHSPRTETTPASLDNRIHQVELRLIAREERLRRGVTELQVRARESLQPRRLLRPLAMLGGVGLAGAAVWWLLRRGRLSRYQAQRPPTDTHAHRRSGWRSRLVAVVGLLTVVPWAPVMSLVWPMVPTRLKQRATPGGAAAALSVALPWLAKFSAPQNALGLVRLWLPSLTGLWEGYLRMKQPRPARPHPPAQQAPG